MKKAIMVLLVFALVVTFSIGVFAGGAEIIETEDGLLIYTAADNANASVTGEENGKAHNNPLYVAGEIR